MSAITEHLVSSQNALPACLWQENPNGLVSLLDMLKFNAHHFVGISSTFGQAIMDIGAGKFPQQRSLSIIAGQCGLLEKYCDELGLRLSVAHLKRLKNDFCRDNFSLAELRSALVEIQQRVWDELESRELFALSPDDGKFFDGSMFPQIVLERFPEVTFDALEAGKCLALERPTACVFHLMRVTEYGLQAIGKQLRIKDERPNWEPIIAKIDAEVRKGYKEREYKGMTDFLANVSAHLNAVKVAWRNRVMHVERKHTMEEAREIHQATCGLMRYIAENLPKEQSGVVATIRAMIKP